MLLPQSPPWLTRVLNYSFKSILDFPMIVCASIGIESDPAPSITLSTIYSIGAELVYKRQYLLTEVSQLSQCPHVSMSANLYTKYTLQYICVTVFAYSLSIICKSIKKPSRSYTSHTNN